MLKIIVSALLLSLSPLSYADCKSLTDSVSKTLGYPDRETENWFSDCKIHPVDSSKTIVALAREQSNPPLDSDAHNLDVLLVDTESGKILQHLLQEGVFPYDAIEISGVTIDTARYKLTPELRAFGVRANFRSNSQRHIFRYETLNLYVSKDKKLKQVLAKLTTVEYSNSGLEYQQNSEDICTAIEYDIGRTLAIAKTSTHSYADLLVQGKTNKSDSNNNCITSTTKATKQYTLHFNGDTYVVPDELKYNPLNVP